MKTWYDIADELMTSVATSTSEGRAIRLAKLAAQEGTQRLSSKRAWTFKSGIYNFATSAKYTTGTIVYDHTGGTYEREVTLTSGTWPAWAQSGTVLISSVPYQVERRVSDTVLTLKSNSNPGADVAAGTSYTIYQQAYTLPADVVSVKVPARLNSWNPSFVSPSQMQQMLLTQEYSGQPRMWTVMQDPADSNRKAIWFYPAPDTSEAFQVLTRRRPSTLKVYDYSTGTVSVSAGATTVTGSGTAFTADMVGGVLRFGTTDNVPESLEAVENAYVEEAEILAVDSATSLTLATAAVSAFTSVKHRISSRIAFDDGVMLDAVRASALSCYHNLLNSSAEQRRGAYARAQEALRDAANEDGCQNDEPSDGWIDLASAIDVAAWFHPSLV